MSDTNYNLEKEPRMVMDCERYGFAALFAGASPSLVVTS
jgi:hypothetical protein